MKLTNVTFNNKLRNNLKWLLNKNEEDYAVFIGNQKGVARLVISLDITIEEPYSEDRIALSYYIGSADFVTTSMYLIPEPVVFINWVLEQSADAVMEIEYNSTGELQILHSKTVNNALVSTKTIFKVLNCSVFEFPDTFAYQDSISAERGHTVLFDGFRYAALAMVSIPNSYVIVDLEGDGYNRHKFTLALANLVDIDFGPGDKFIPITEQKEEARIPMSSTNNADTPAQMETATPAVTAPQPPPPLETVQEKRFDDIIAGAAPSTINPITSTVAVVPPPPPSTVLEKPSEPEGDLSSAIEIVKPAQAGTPPAVTAQETPAKAEETQPAAVKPQPPPVQPQAAAILQRLTPDTLPPMKKRGRPPTKPESIARRAAEEAAYRARMEAALKQTAAPKAASEAPSQPEAAAALKVLKDTAVPTPVPAAQETSVTPVSTASAAVPTADTGQPEQSVSCERKAEVVNPVVPPPVVSMEVINADVESAEEKVQQETAPLKSTTKREPSFVSYMAFTSCEKLAQQLAQEPDPFAAFGVLLQENAMYLTRVLELLSRLTGQAKSLSEYSTSELLAELSGRVTK